MSSSIGITQPQSYVPAHHRHHGRADAAATQTGQAGSPAPGATASNTSPALGGAAASSTPAGGLAQFASELQSILLGAQAAPANGTAAASASDPGTAADTGTAEPVRQLADRLQSLLGNPSGSTTAGTDQTGLQSILNTLQQTLQQKLASYGSQATTANAGVTA